MARECSKTSCGRALIELNDVQLEGALTCYTRICFIGPKASCNMKVRPSSQFLFVNLNIVHSARYLISADMKFSKEAVARLILNSQSAALKISVHVDMLVTDLVGH